jgi:hypothetical protein
MIFLLLLDNNLLTKKMRFFDKLTENLFDGGPSYTHEVVTSKEPELKSVLEILNQIYNISRNNYPRIRLIFLRLPKEADLTNIQDFIDEVSAIISKKPQRFESIAELISQLDVEINKDFGTINANPDNVNAIEVLEETPQSPIPIQESPPLITFSLEKATNETVQIIKSELREYLQVDNTTVPWFFQNGIRDVISIEVNSYQDLLRFEEAIDSYRKIVYDQKYNFDLSYLIPILKNYLYDLSIVIEKENQDVLSTPKV